MSLIAGFAFAFGLGANDMANSFATAVGAKAVTIFQAVVIAAIFEFLGAVLLGSAVTSTVKNSIADTSAFENVPELLMFGFFAVMVAGATWDITATHFGFPVSTTHTVIGAIIGMAVAISGFGAVDWCSSKDDFPYISGFVPVLLAWVVSPVVSSICVLILYGSLRFFVFRAPNSFTRAMFVLPFLVGLTFFVVVTFIIQTGNDNETWESTGDAKAIWIGIVCAVGLGLLSIPLLLRLRKSILEEEVKNEKAAEDAAIDAAMGAEATAEAKSAYLGDVDAANKAGIGNSLSAWCDKTYQSKTGQLLLGNKVVKALTYGSTYKVHNVVDETHADFDVHSAKVWQQAERFDTRTERLFRYLQVFSATVMAFAHGANDVANVMGPFAGVYAIWKTGKVPDETPVPEWILVIGGVGISLGLAILGYRILRVLGVSLVKLSNTRGFCAELSTAITVLIASRYGLPVSTTQTVTGALLAVGLFEGVGGVNWRTAVKTFIGWGLTFICAALVSAGVTSFALYAPNKQAAFAFPGQYYG